MFDDLPALRADVGLEWYGLGTLRRMGLGFVVRELEREIAFGCTGDDEVVVGVGGESSDSAVSPTGELRSAPKCIDGKYSGEASPFRWFGDNMAPVPTIVGAGVLENKRE